jgi:cation diffusion facilitator CzcD-associated flavoprotein CzcO
MKDLLIVGAGPYGLSLAAAARRRGIDSILLGEAMGFWKRCMPHGLLLRSEVDWQLCPAGEDTLERYLKEEGVPPEAWEPIPLERFLGYAGWFQERAGVAARPSFVRRLERREGGFEAELDDGDRVAARNVVVAPGFGPFANRPAEVAAALPAERCAHTSEAVDFAPLAGRRCLIVGGRQSAFEWAALIREAGAAAVHVVYRHPTPRFAPSDWTWVTPMLQATLEVPGWFRSLPPVEQQAIAERFWAEGRLKLEPWLAPRVDRDGITLWPNTRVAGSQVTPAGDLRVRLDSGAEVAVDRVILATGYRAECDRLPYLGEAIRRALRVEEGYPELDAAFQSTVPGLFFTSFCSTKAFGPFFGFVAGAPVTARIIAACLEGTAAA